MLRGAVSIAENIAVSRAALSGVRPVLRLTVGFTFKAPNENL
jgi:hypothetical protein